MPKGSKAASAKQVTNSGKRAQLLGKRYTKATAEQYKKDLREYNRLAKKLAKAGVIPVPTSKQPTSAISKAIRSFASLLTGQQKAVPVPKGSKAALRRAGITVTKGGTAILEKGQRITGKAAETRVSGRGGQARIIRRVSVRRSDRTITEVVDGAFAERKKGEYVATTIGGHKSYKIYDDADELLNVISTYRAVRERANVELVIIGLPDTQASAWQIDGRARLKANLKDQPRRLSEARKKHRAAENARRRNKG